MGHNSGPLHLILVILALLFFAFGALTWPVPEPHRVKLISAGLFFWVLSTFF